MNDMARTLILGSSSPYRRELMERLHLDFETFKPEIDEQATRRIAASAGAGAR